MRKDDPKVVDQRVEILLGLDRTAEARTQLEAAVGAWPGEARLWGQLARTLLRLGEADRGLVAADRAIELDLADDWGYRLRSIALESLGRRAEAEEAARNAVRLAPSSWMPHVRLAELLGTFPGRMDEAKEAAREGIRLAPHEPRAHLGLARLAASAQQWREVEDSARAALELDPHDTDALHLLGRAQRGQEKLEEALGSFRAVVSADPGRRAARDEMLAMVWRSATVGPVALVIASLVLLLMMPEGPPTSRWHTVLLGLAALPAVLFLLVYQVGEVGRYQRKVPGYLRSVLRAKLWLAAVAALGLAGSAVLVVWWFGALALGEAPSLPLRLILDAGLVGTVGGVIGEWSADDRGSSRSTGNPVLLWPEIAVLGVLTMIPLGVLSALSWAGGNLAVLLLAVVLSVLLLLCVRQIAHHSEATRAMRALRAGILPRRALLWCLPALAVHAAMLACVAVVPAWTLAAIVGATDPRVPRLGLVVAAILTAAGVVGFVVAFVYGRAWEKRNRTEPDPAQPEGDVEAPTVNRPAGRG